MYQNNGEKIKRIEIFEDTIKKIKADIDLKKNVEESISKSKIYIEPIEFYRDNYNVYEPQIITRDIRSFASMKLFDKTIEKPCVLNFASAKNPGGGVANGSNAQEECLCRCSTLYSVISNDKFFKEYYGYHRHLTNTLYTNRIVYSPNITIIKKDEKIPTILEKENWSTCDVITCAAPNLRQQSIKDTELLEIMKDRVREIVKCAIINRNDGIVLGAFGCGAFKCSPLVVSRAFKEILIDENYAIYFKTIIFAVLGTPDLQNFNVFKRTFQKYEKK